MNKITASLLLLLVTLVNTGLAFQCYSCTTVDDPNCGDPFNPTEMNTKECVLAQYDTLMSRHPKFQDEKELGAYCVRYDGTDVEGNTHTVRTCSLLGVDTCAIIEQGATEEGSTISKCKICSSNLCNDAQSIVVLPALLVALIVALNVL